MCSCIFGVFVGERKFKNLLCHHLGDIPGIRIATYELGEDINIQSIANTPSQC